ncbi:hypothetical protein THOD04_40002 [Vibrio owensii]|nr:hypothetical protein THOD04_40002 [Vibrio owensii]
MRFQIFFTSFWLNNMSMKKLDKKVGFPEWCPLLPLNTIS